jgi:methyltransferase (TIGR00027 family)
MHSLAKTALWVAMARAQEHNRPDRLFEDSYASVLAGPEGAESWSRLEQQFPEASRSRAIPIRTRFFDDTLASLVGAEGVDQIVLLGAGMDTIAFRLQLPPTVTVFELDYPELLAIKDDRLRQVGASPSCQRVTVGTDLTTNWTTDLLRSGFQPQRATAWLMEGLLVLLEEADVHQLLNHLSTLISGRAWLLADILGRSYLDFPPLHSFMDVQAANGAPLRFGTDDPEGLLGGHGWNTAVTQLGDEGANFGHWTQPVAPRDAPQHPHAYFVVARQICQHPEMPRSK